MTGGTPPGILNTISGTFKVPKATIWKFVPSRGGCDLPFPDPAHLHRLAGEVLSCCVGSLVG